MMNDVMNKKKILNEIYLLKTLNHQNVIRLLEVFQNTKFMFFVMEYAPGGDLLHYVKKRRKIAENEAKVIFK